MTMPKVQPQMAPTRAKRVAEYAQARAFHQQGWTVQALSPHRGRHHRAVQKSLEAATCPARPPRRQPPSILAPSKASLLERGQAGYRRAKALDHEVQAPGLPSQARIVAASVSRWRPPQGRLTRRRQPGSPATSVEGGQPLTPRRATWLVTRREAKRNADAKPQRARLPAQEGAIAEAIELTSDSAAFVQQRQRENVPQPAGSRRSRVLPMAYGRMMRPSQQVSL